MIKYQYLCDTDIFYLRECILMQRVRRILFLIAYVCLMGMIFNMPVYATKVQEQVIWHAENSSEYPNMTLDEHFLLFGTYGDETLYTYEEIENALNRIREKGILNNRGEQDCFVEEDRATVSTMTTGPKGIELIKTWEGLELKAYKATSSEKYYTIGYGHHGSDVTADMVITKEQAEELLANDIRNKEIELNSYIKENRIVVNQNQFDALMSFTYNLGLAKWSGSHDVPTMLMAGQEGFSVETVRHFFTQWRMAGGKVLPGLENRRNAEVDVFLTPCYDMCSVSRISINTGGQVGEVIHLSLTDDVVKDSGAYISVTHRDKTTKYRIADLTTTNDCRLQVDLPIRYATDTITVYIHRSDDRVVELRNGNTSDGKGYNFSLDEYRKYVVEVNNIKLLNLIDVLKKYSACADAYFGGSSTDKYAVSDFSAATLAKNKRVISGGVDGLDYIGTSLVLEGDMKMKYYFRLDEGRVADDYTYYINGTRVDKVVDGSAVYLLVGNIAAADIDDSYTIKITDKRGQSLSVNAGPLSYAYSAFEYDKSELKNLMANMYNYNKAAETYFGS